MPLRAFVILFLLLIVAARNAYAAEGLPVEIRAQLGHASSTDAISTIAISPDGRLAASADASANLKLWDVATGRLLRDLHGHGGDIAALKFSSDGRKLLSGSADQTAILWDVVTGKVLQTFDPKERSQGRILSVEFLPDGRVVTSGEWQPLMIWDAANGKLLRPINIGEGRWIRISPDGQHVLVGGIRKRVELWGLASGKRIRSFPTRSELYDRIYWLDNRTIIIAGDELSVWAIDQPKPRRQFKGQWHARDYSPTAGLAVFGDSGKANLIDVETGKVRATLDLNDCPADASSPARSSGIWQAAFTSDGATMIVASRTGTLHVWDQGKCVRSFLANPSAARVAVYTRDGRTIAAGGADGSVRLWDTATGKLLRSMKGEAGSVWSLASSRDARLLIAGTEKSVTLWNASTGEAVWTQTMPGYVLAVGFAEDEQEVIAAGLSSVVAFDARSGKILRTHKSEDILKRPSPLGPPYRIFDSVAISPNGRQIAFSTGCLDGVVVSVYDLHAQSLIFESAPMPMERPVYFCESGRRLAFSPDGQRLLSSHLSVEYRLWDITQRQMVHTFRSSTRGALSMNFSFDGRQVISSGAFSLTLWDAATGQQLRSFDLTVPVVSAAFSPDGRRAALADAEGITIWSLDKGEVVAWHVANPADEWLSLTMAGFFDASSAGDRLLHAVRGLEIIELDQVFSHLYRPDLLQARLNDDPHGNYKEAASKLNLSAIVDSGPAPQLERLAEREERIGNDARLSIRVTDTGGGIASRLTWRVNGVAQGNQFPAGLAGELPALSSTIVSETLKLVPGQPNTVEVVAYNRAGLVATAPLRFIIDSFGITAGRRPQMWVLALGVDAYRMKGYRLNYAAKDAKTFAQSLHVVGSTLYSKVVPKVLTDQQVTEAGIDAAIKEIARQSSIEDVFVLYLAGHGRAIDGRYYYFPQSLDFEKHAIVEHAIGQAKWESWLALVPAQKSMLVIDTCEAEAAGPLVRGRESEAVRQTVMAQLQRSTGHSLIAAARNAAFEGYRGHGILTFALLEALDATQGQPTSDVVRVGTLAEHAYERVPQISRRISGEEQKPYSRMSGENFAIGTRQSLLPLVATADSIPKQPSHVLIRNEVVRQKPAFDAAGVVSLSAGTQLRSIEAVGEWVAVARDGQRLGYVPFKALAQLQ